MSEKGDYLYDIREDIENIIKAELRAEENNVVVSDITDGILRLICETYEGHEGHRWEYYEMCGEYEKQKCHYCPATRFKTKKVGITNEPH